MYAKTLFLVDRDATIGGVAAGFADLDSLGARDVDLERLPVPVLSLSLDRVAEMGREAHASLVAVGVADPASLRELSLSGRAALSDHPLLYLGVSSPPDMLLPLRARILSHVLAPGDYSVRSGCVAACLSRVAANGVRVVTLMHVPDATLSAHCARPAVGELGRVDTDWIDQIKRMLFSAGVDEVRFVSTAGGASELADLNPPVSLIIAGRTCSEEIAAAYVSAAGRLISRHRDVPALMLTAESCSAASSRLGAA